MKPKALWNPYVGGMALGLVLLATFLLMGYGLGSSGAAARIGCAVSYCVAPAAVQSSDYMSHYVGPHVNALDNWMVFLVIGVFLGGLLSSTLAGRNKREVLKGENSDWSTSKRLLFALVGGILMGIAARFSRGCTSGQALSGGALLSVGSWAFMMAVFAGGYLMAPFVKRQWQ